MKLRQRLRFLILFLSLLLFPVTMYLLSPYLPMMGAGETIITGSLIVFLGLAVSAVFLGRSFCSWLCPAGGLQEIAAVTRPKTVKRKKINWLKFVIWLPWLGLIVFIGMKAGGFKSAELFYQFEKGVSISNPGAYIIYYGVMVIFLILSLTLGKRAGCHTICWMAPFMILGRKLGKLLHIPSLMIKAEPDKCVSCGKCTKVCSMSINVMEDLNAGSIQSADCINCGACADNCEKGVFTYKFLNK